MKLAVFAAAIITAATFTASAQMQSGVFGNDKDGFISADGKRTTAIREWLNPCDNDILIWGLQADLWFDMFIPPGESADALFGQGFSARHYFQSIADTGIAVMRKSDNMAMLRKGSDHYDNAPCLNAGGPTWFPVPFFLAKGDRLKMVAFLSNGWQRTYGGQINWNTEVTVYFTASPLPQN